MADYVAPTIVRLGHVADLTLDPGQGHAYGKGSVTPDGLSGLAGNRSGG